LFQVHLESIQLLMKKFNALHRIHETTHSY
jgi:hypothetical protein